MTQSNSIDWEVMNVLNVEDSWNFFMSQISSTVERNSPYDDNFVIFCPFLCST